MNQKTLLKIQHNLNQLMDIWAILYLYNYKKLEKNYTKKDLESIISRIDGIIGKTYSNNELILEIQENIDHMIEEYENNIENMQDFIN